MLVLAEIFKLKLLLVETWNRNFISPQKFLSVGRQLNLNVKS